MILLQDYFALIERMPYSFCGFQTPNYKHGIKSRYVQRRRTMSMMMMRDEPTNSWLMLLCFISFTPIQPTMIHPERMPKQFSFVVVVWSPSHRWWPLDRQTDHRSDTCHPIMWYAHASTNIELEVPAHLLYKTLAQSSFSLLGVWKNFF